ncbi:MAG: amylo-alpha-1,6-glucosidase [Planctomycetota bacterium]|nr:amylo-alpha-1,6-glucosidase [Planctomycetota bacterium]
MTRATESPLSAASSRVRSAGPGGLAQYVREDFRDPEAATATEWLLTNGSGAFSMGSVLGPATRRYHALLVAATAPPVGRVVVLSAVAKQLRLGDRDGEAIDLSTFRFQGAPLHPAGWRHLERFERDLQCRWTWRVEGWRVLRELTLWPGENTVTIRYAVETAQGGSLRLTPLVRMQDFHALLRHDHGKPFDGAPLPPGGCVVESTGLRLELRASSGSFLPHSDWWRNFRYDREAERGQDFIEDLFSPGAFEIALPGGSFDVTLEARLQVGASKPSTHRSPARLLEERSTRLERALSDLTRGRPRLAEIPETAALVQAADDFIVERRVDGAASRTVLAGYPWFSDWGRDTVIALPGLMLTTRRFDDAKMTLSTFARHVQRGLIPNLFDDATGAAHYNTVDAALWFVHAACAYHDSSGDREFFDETLAPACLAILEHYRDGTDFEIAMDPADGLIRAGSRETQLTWMDAARDGVIFTPRFGKPVEINALWIHGLQSMAAALVATDAARATELESLADRAGASFRRLFWIPEEQRLHDCLMPGDGGAWTPSRHIRPNQIFAASLEYSPLSLEQRRGVVNCVREHLLTRHGLRTLAPREFSYRPRFEGDMFSRDAAYHNGTVWPWLIGAYIEALLRVEGFSDAAKAEARQVIRPLLDSLASGCLGQIAEVYDGDDSAERPQREGGCPAQAWSVAELLRSLALIEG